MLLKMVKLAPLVVASVASMAASAKGNDAPFVSKRAPVPVFECKAYVAYDRDQVLPGYLLPTKSGAKTCIPFTSSRYQPPKGYKGDYYVDEFTDAKLRANWEACKRDKECHGRVFAQVMKRHPPNGEFNLTDKHGRFLLGKIDEKGGDTDLTQVRRPGFFARAPYSEPIASVDPDTYVVEFTVPVEAYERIHRKMTGDIKIRGWYIRGKGIDDGKGGRKRGLIIHSGGGGDRVVAIDDPKDVGYVTDANGITVPNDTWPNETTGVQGQRRWREAFRLWHEAGFDVLALDRRGIGISGGYSDTNTLQQGNDLLSVVEQLRTGKGLRTLTPDGKVILGTAAVTAVRGNAAGPLPVILSGSSRGTMASGFAMAANFDKICSYDLPTITCRAPKRDLTIKGAMLHAEFSSGVGYLPLETAPKDDGRGPGKDRGLFIGGIELEHNVVFFPSSAILASMSKWPSVFLARGLWCYADGLEGSMDGYSRVNGPKELVVVRGPHAFTTWPDEERQRVADRLIAYGRAVLLGQSTIPGGRPWRDMKELVATTSDVWEPSTKPTVVN
ncbi:MAG: hypothetical protein V4530_00065 [Pseudomonadota bacterium]